MLHQIKEFGTYAEITGFQSREILGRRSLPARNTERKPALLNCNFYDADLIATRKHLYFAVLNALQAFHNKTNVAKSLAVETMLYASAQRQIQRAIQRCGIKPQTQNMAVVIIGGKPRKFNVLRKLAHASKSSPMKRVGNDQV